MIKGSAETDRHVGARIRMRRVQIKMSQDALAQALGLTFQQIQKYEKGANRVGAGRLQLIADLLAIPVGWFFEGRPGPAGAIAAGPAAPPDAVMADLLTRDGYSLLRAFARIPDARGREAVIACAQALARTGDAAPEADEAPAGATPVVVPLARVAQAAA